MRFNLKHIVTLLFAVIFLGSSPLLAQGCAMCKAVAESNIAGGGAEASGLNFGILYLMVFPYLILIVIAFFWRRHQKSIASEISDN